MNKTIVWLCVLAVVAVAAAVGFFTLNGGEENRSAVADPPDRTPATDSSAELPGLPAIPTPSLSPGSEEAQRALEIQRIIFEVTQEAIKRPKDDRMTAEEIEAAINTRIEELKARP